LTSGPCSCWFFLVMKQRIFLIVLRLPGDGYFLLGSKKSLCGTKIKSKKKSQNSRTQGFSYYFWVDDRRIRIRIHRYPLKKWIRI
jgi:hypothetical protein